MTYIEIDARSQIPIYEQIMDRIRTLVRHGELPPGTTLPSVRQLAADLEINPNTVVKAYGLLEREGILETVPRQGTLVAASAAQVAERSRDGRLERAIDRVLEEASSLGVELDELVEALERRRYRRFP